MSSDSDSDAIFKTTRPPKRKKCSALDLDDLVGKILKQKEIHGKSHERAEWRKKSDRESLGSAKQSEPEEKEENGDDIAEEVFDEFVFTKWPKKLPETENLRKKESLSWWEIFEIYYNDYHKDPPPNEICNILYRLVCYHNDKLVVGEAFRVLSAFITQKKKLSHGQSEEAVWYMTDTRKRLRCGKKATKRTNSWIPTVGDILESLTEYGVEVEAFRQRFEQNRRPGDQMKEYEAKSNDIRSFPWHNLEKLLELVGMAMQYRGNEFQRNELALVAFMLLSFLESKYLQHEEGSTCRHRVQTVIGDIILAIEEPRESEKDPPIEFVWKIVEACETTSSKLNVVESIPICTSSAKKMRRLLAVETLRALTTDQRAPGISSSKHTDEQNIITNAKEILRSQYVAKDKKLTALSQPRNEEVERESAQRFRNRLRIGSISRYGSGRDR